jgi:hypothetical protein
LKTGPSTPVVVCADAVRALYPTSVISLKALAICGPFFLLGTLLKMEWLGMIGIALAGGLLIVPYVLRTNRFINSLPCASCGLPAGRFTTVKFVVHLECIHCGHLSRTDCMYFGPGKPTKV